MWTKFTLNATKLENILQEDTYDNKFTKYAY